MNNDRNIPINRVEEFNFELDEIRKVTMKKLFISQPMRGKSEEEIQEERRKAIEAAERHLGQKVEVIDSYFEDYNPDGGSIPLKYLSKSIELLADADVAYFAKGWEDARGCRIENRCAIDYGITVIEDYK